eukprot:CAMPEP_0119085228 /NCGR_PEP_ID=MMETSP1178-20130426/132844_1 /TAXON_ID=33656 /ORGANISM="unid sp, Strain CCMP2000" /LENGTH=33 /DNA_ID= /DNA_START= /DNA_END= /DNA_ORIENTATION=
MKVTRTEKELSRNTSTQKVKERVTTAGLCRNMA